MICAAFFFAVAISKVGKCNSEYYCLFSVAAKVRQEEVIDSRTKVCFC